MEQTNRLKLLATVCCMISTVAWGQVKAEIDTLRYEVNPQQVRQYNPQNEMFAGFQTKSIFPQNEKSAWFLI